MKIANEDGVLVWYITPRLYVHTINNWFSFGDFKITKFFEFALINVYFDRDDMLDRYDFGIVLLGVGISLKVNVFN